MPPVIVCVVETGTPSALAGRVPHRVGVAVHDPVGGADRRGDLHRPARARDVSSRGAYNAAPRNSVSTNDRIAGPSPSSSARKRSGPNDEPRRDDPAGAAAACPPANSAPRAADVPTPSVAAISVS